jgi:hypothetical protein
MNRELEDQLYARVAQEVSEGTFCPAPMARAREKSSGNFELAKSLYIKFRVEQLAREVKQEAQRKKLESNRLTREAREEERRRQLESEQFELELRRQRDEEARKIRQEAKNLRKEVRNARTDTEKFFTSFFITLFAMIVLFILLAAFS